MKTTGQRKGVTLGLVGMGLLLAGWLAWTQGAPAFVNRYRAHLPAAVIAWALTPLPTALPAPAQAAPAPRITIPAETVTTPTSVPLPATFTLPPVSAGSLPATATATPTPTATPTITPTPLPASVRLSGLRIVPQNFNNCGPANLSMVLNFYGLAIDQVAAGEWLKPNNLDRNVNPGEMQAFVRAQTRLAADVYYGLVLDHLRRLLAAGFPVIIEKGYEPNDDAWMGHYLTLFGYDEARQVFYGLDTFLGPWDGQGREESYAAVAANWQHFNYATVVVYPPAQAAQVQAIVGAEYSDAQRMWQNAASRAQAEIEREPENAFAWFNLGSSLTELGRLADEPAPYNAQATAAFDQARTLGLPFRMLWYQFTPYEAYLGAGRLEDVLALAEATISTEGGQTIEETYLYQGRVWEQQGDVEAARAAYSRAISLNPRFAAAAAALAALNGGGGSGE